MVFRWHRSVLLCISFGLYSFYRTVVLTLSGRKLTIILCRCNTEKLFVDKFKSNSPKFSIF